MSDLGFIRFTYVDRDAEEYVSLADLPAMTTEAVQAFFERLPPANDPDSDFLADLWPEGEDYGHTESKAVSAAFIELATGHALDLLLAAGRASNESYRRLLAGRQRRR